MRRDLTRWNRAGLSRFRYVDGNAVTFLDDLREALRAAYTDPDSGALKWAELATRHAPEEEGEQGEEEADRLKRLAAQYEDVRRDHAWEILRTFARSTHVLTEHLDAFANETFLSTATQRESVRRLIAMLDARPGPGASARTEMAIIAAEAGTLKAGFAMKATNPVSGAPLVFETLQDLEIDPAFNALRPVDWNRSAEPVALTPEATITLELDPAAVAKDPPVAGEAGVLLVEEDDGGVTGYGLRVDDADAARVFLSLADAGVSRTLEAWRLTLLLGAARIEAPRLAGSDVVRLSEGHNLAAGRSRISWNDGGWKTAKVVDVDGDRVKLDGSIPGVGEDLFLLTQSRAQDLSTGRTIVLPRARGGGGNVWAGNLNAFASSSITPQIEEGIEIFDKVPADLAYFVPAGADPVAEVKESGVSGLTLGGKVEDIAQGDWLLSGTGLQALEVQQVTVGERDTVVVTTTTPADPGGLVHAAFARRLRPFEHDRNRRVVHDTAALSDEVTRIAVEAVPDGLIAGRAVVVADGILAHAATLRRVDATVTPPVLEIAPPLPQARLTAPTTAAMERWNTVIHANVVVAGHGESQSAKPIGSGDATQSSQVFEVPAKEIAFVTDPAMPAGVRPAVELTVSGRRFTQIANLADSAFGAANYEARVSADGTVHVVFGDGRTASRLTTGTDNVRAVWRQGSGEQGNLPPGSIAKPKRRDPRVQGVIQRLASSGGAAAEGLASMRENAAAGLLTLGRQVSVSDFAASAARNATVWQAAAERLQPGGARCERVRVVVVPAGGVLGGLKTELEAFLQATSVPGVSVTVESFVTLPLSLDVEVAVREDEFVLEEVAAAVRAAIDAAYDIKSARLGAPLYRAQLVTLIEGVRGVENVALKILPATWAGVMPAPRIGAVPSGGVRAVHPAFGQMIHVAATSAIAVRPVAYRS